MKYLKDTVVKDSSKSVRAEEFIILLDHLSRFLLKNALLLTSSVNFHKRVITLQGNSSLSSCLN